MRCCWRCATTQRWRAGDRAGQRRHRGHRRPVRGRRHLRRRRRAAGPAHRRRPGGDRARRCRWCSVSPTRCVQPGSRASGRRRRPPRIEGSKSFAKDVMAAAGVRTATSEIVDNPAHLDAALDRFGPAGGDPAWVVKDDGLAAGKGVVVTADRDAARAHARQPARRRATRCCSSRSSTDRRCRCSASSTARRWCRCCPRRTSSASATTTPGPTPAAWARYAPLPWLPDDVDGPDRQRHRETRCRGAGSAAAARSRVCFTPGWRSRRRGRRWSNSTAASAIRRPSPCWRCSNRHSANCCMPRQPVVWPSSRQLRWRDGAAGDRGAGRRELSGTAAGGRRHRRRRSRRRAARGHARDATTARSCPRAAGCCRWSGRARPGGRPRCTPTR